MKPQFGDSKGFEPTNLKTWVPSHRNGITFKVDQIVAYLPELKFFHRLGKVEKVIGGFVYITWFRTNESAVLPCYLPQLVPV